MPKLFTPNRGGYTLVELLIVISLTAILITISVGAYSRASEIQNIRATTETILATLSSAQQSSSIGRADCLGPYLGEQLTNVSGENTLTITSLCQGDTSNNTRSVVLNNFEFASSNTLLFRPLNQGVDTGVDNYQYLDYTSDNKVYRILIERSGSIQNLGLISP